MTTHPRDEDLILYFYGESQGPGTIERHLEECEACASLYRDIASTLMLVSAPDSPERGESYGVEVWRRIHHRLTPEEPMTWTAWLRVNRLAMAAAVLVFVASALAAAGFWSRLDMTGPQPAAAPVVASDASERVRTAAIADHLEQSERVLLDVVNASGPSVDVSNQQAWAAELIDSNRIYRDAALRAGDADVANLLDELERSLLEIVHGPSTLTSAQLADVIVRLDTSTLLFKVRVLSDELHEREVARLVLRKTT